MTATSDAAAAAAADELFARSVKIQQARCVTIIAARAPIQQKEQWLHNWSGVRDEVTQSEHKFTVTQHRQATGEG